VIDSFGNDTDNLIYGYRPKRKNKGKLAHWRDVELSNPHSGMNSGGMLMLDTEAEYDQNDWHVQPIPGLEQNMGLAKADSVGVLREPTGMI
jgi:hypothetical protein